MSKLSRYVTEMCMKLIIKYKQAEWLTGNMPDCKELVIRNGNAMD